MAIKSVLLLWVVMASVLLICQDVAYARVLTEANGFEVKNVEPTRGKELEEEKGLFGGEGFGGSGIGGDRQPLIGGGYTPVINGGYQPGIGGGHQPVIRGGYPPVINGGYQPLIGGGYQPLIGGGYPPVMNGGYQPGIGGGYQPPVIGGGYPIGAYGGYGVGLRYAGGFYPRYGVGGGVGADGAGTYNLSDNTQMSLDIRNAQGEIPIRSNRKGGRAVVGKGVSGVIRSSRSKVQKDVRGTRAIDDGPLKQRAGEASSTFMLHRKIPASFLDRAEDFFCSEI